MRFMMMHKHDKTTEAGVMPSGAFIEEMGSFIGGLAQQGVLKDGAGLGKSASRTRLVFKQGERTVKDGPYSGTNNELVASCLQLTTKSRAEAVGWASKLGRALGDAQIEVGKTTEEWDLGLAPEPENAPYHALVLVMATPASERGEALSPAVRAAVDGVKKEMTATGVLTGAITLAPSARAVRLHMGGGKRKATDGPFAESKELIGGFAMVELPSREDAIALCWRYGELLLKSVEALEIDVREVVAD